MFQAYILLLLLCLCAYFINRKKLPPYFVYLGWLIFVVISFEVVSRYLQTNGKNNNPLDHLYQLIEIWLLSLAYYHVLKNKTVKKIIIAMLVAVTIFYPISSFLIEGIYAECTLSFLINSFLIVLLSMVFFYDLNTQNSEMHILSMGFFWINCGNLIYSCGTFFQMGLHSYVEGFDTQLAADLNLINQILNYFLYAIYLIGFLCIKKQKP